MTTFITAVLSFAVVGAIVSAFIELSTKRLSKFGSKIATIVVSLIAGGILMVIYGSSYEDAFLGALGAASTVYAFIVKK